MRPASHLCVDVVGGIATGIEVRAWLVWTWRQCSYISHACICLPTYTSLRPQVAVEEEEQTEEETEEKGEDADVEVEKETEEKKKETRKVA